MKSQREQSQKIDLHLLVRLQQCQHVLSKSRSLRVANGAGHKATSKWAGRHRDKHPGGCRTALWRTKHHRQQLPAGWASTPGNQCVSPGCCCRVVRELQARGQQCSVFAYCGYPLCMAPKPSKPAGKAAGTKSCVQKKAITAVGNRHQQREMHPYHSVLDVAISRRAFLPRVEGIFQEPLITKKLPPRSLLAGSS